MRCELAADGFALRWEPQFFADAPVNTRLRVSVRCAGFAGESTMDTAAGQLARFAADLRSLWETLSGEARIGEPYGRQRIALRGDGRGHVLVEGELESDAFNGLAQRLRFAGQVDQTQLEPFLRAVEEVCVR